MGEGQWSKMEQKGPIEAYTSLTISDNTFHSVTALPDIQHSEIGGQPLKQSGKGMHNTCLLNHIHSVEHSSPSSYLLIVPYTIGQHFAILLKMHILQEGHSQPLNGADGFNISQS